jgi:DNA helicase-2/ATP-dependent DNA helicase PcrA
MSFPATAEPIDFSTALNPQQLAAVTAPAGPALVLAGAGSGKTRTLTYRVAYLLSQGVPPWQILLLTFTNKAAREMLERVEKLTGIEAKQFWGGTFHHIGQRILRKHGELIKIPPSFTIMDQSEAESVLNEAIKAAAGASFLRDKTNPKLPLIANILSFSRNTLQSVGEVIASKYAYLEEKIEPLNKFQMHYTALKRNRNLCDYDDLLELWLQLLKEHPAVARELGEKFRHLLVDEYQDTNAIQSAIIDLMAPHHRIMAVGDDAQCIYTWRGAEVENILSFPERHTGTQIYKIELNYRSTPPILTLANSVLSAANYRSIEIVRAQPSGEAVGSQGVAPTNIPLRQGGGKGVGSLEEFHKILKPVRAGSVKPYIVPVVDGRAQAQFIVRKVRELNALGRSMNEMIILYRAHFHAMELQLELTRLGIPFSITSGMRFFEQAHVKDLIAQLRFAFNPKDSAAFCRLACLLPKVGEVTALKLYNDILGVYNRGSGNVFVPKLFGAVDASLRQTEDGELPYSGSSTSIPDDKGSESQGVAAHSASSEPSGRSPENNFPLQQGGGQGVGYTLGEAMKHPSVVARVGEIAKEDYLSLAETIAELEKVLKMQESPMQITHHAIEGWYSGFIRTLYPNWDSRLEDLNSLESFANRFDNFAEYLSQLVLLNAEATDRSVEPAGDSLRLSTVHQAKGLEFPVVFVIGLAEGMFPGRRAIEENSLEEERRLFYVAVTRAKDELYLSYPLLNMAAHSGTYQQLPSRFLEQLPQDSFELVNTGAGSFGGGSQTAWRSGRSNAGWEKTPAGGAPGDSWKKSAAASQKYSSKTSPESYDGQPSFSRTAGSYGDLPTSKAFDNKTNTNAKKLFKW